MNDRAPGFPTLEGIRELLRWRAALDRPVEEHVGWQPTALREDGVHQMGYPMYGNEVEGFLRDLARLGFIVVFAWPDWIDEAKEVQFDPAKLGRADLTTLCELLTLHVRRERFVEGHIAECLEHGWFVAILDRLAGIVEVADASEQPSDHELLRNREGLTSL